MKYKIIVDSCGELTEEMRTSGVFERAPLCIDLMGTRIVDDETFDQADFLRRVADAPECPTSACPSPEVYRKAFDCGADHVYAVTLSARLSGSYNSARLGQQLQEERGESPQIHVFNSRSASVGETLIARKIQACEDAGMPFSQVVDSVEAYIRSLRTFFVLEDLETLRKSGRLSTVKATLAQALQIRPILGSDPTGDIAFLGQARGMKKALTKMGEEILRTLQKPRERILGIAHCHARERALSVREHLEQAVDFQDVILLPTGGISSMYAAAGGVIVVV